LKIFKKSKEILKIFKNKKIQNFKKIIPTLIKIKPPSIILNPLQSLFPKQTPFNPLQPILPIYSTLFTTEINRP